MSDSSGSAERRLRAAHDLLLQQSAELQRQADQLEARTRELDDAVRLARRREAWFRALVEYADDVIMVVDARRRIAYVSPSTSRILGYEDSEILGRRVLDLVHPEDREQARARLATLDEQPGAVISREVRYVHADGTPRLLAGYACNLLDDEAVRGIVINSRDVTESRHLESQLRQAQKMEAIGRLAGGVAHDFNNLLTTIRGYTEFVADAIGAGHPALDDLGEVTKAAAVASTLTRQLLAFSREQVLRPVSLDLNHVVEDCANLLRRLLGSDIELQLRLAAELRAVTVDPGQMRQVIMNLAVNARDAMPAGGRLVVETRNAELSNDYAAMRYDVRPGRYVMLGVSDTGEGIPLDIRDRIFEPFFTTKPPGEGTGLGLSTTYGIVQQSNGYIWAYSEVGEGTTFKVYLPISTDETQYQAEPDDAHDEDGDTLAADGTHTLLIVEDDEAVRSFACRSLERAGHRLLTATTAQEALDLLSSAGTPVSLVLTDVIMPGMSGTELGRRIAEEHPTTAVLYTSGYPRGEMPARAALPAHVDFIEKPYTSKSLIEAVRTVLAQTVS